MLHENLSNLAQLRIRKPTEQQLDDNLQHSFQIYNSFIYNNQVASLRFKRGESALKVGA